MKLLIDMNLSPAWAQALQQHGFLAIHWSEIGDGNASDPVLLKWAHENKHVVFTNDLDFGAILAATGGKSPSVVQVRSQDVTPEHMVDIVVRALRQHEAILAQGVLISIDEARSRARILPLRSSV